MPQPVDAHLSRRERQIMDAVYRLGEATAAEVQRTLPDEVGYDSVRVTLSILERKGFLDHRQEGPRYVYAPTIPHERASSSALDHVLRTFFRGSPSRAILRLLDSRRGQLSANELDEIEAWVRRAKEERDR